MPVPGGLALNELARFEASVQGEPVGVDESMSRSGTLPKVDIAASGSIDKTTLVFLTGWRACRKRFWVVFFPHHHVFGQKMWISRAESQDETRTVRTNDSNFPPLRQSHLFPWLATEFLQSMQLVIHVVGDQICDTALEQRVPVNVKRKWQFA